MYQASPRILSARELARPGWNVPAAIDSQAFACVPRANACVPRAFAVVSRAFAVFSRANCLPAQAAGLALQMAGADSRAKTALLRRFPYISKDL